jgi:fumarate hydratase, class I
MTFSEKNYQPIFEKTTDTTQYTKLDFPELKTIQVDGAEYLKIPSGLLVELSEKALDDVSHLLRSSHLEKLSRILTDAEASENDKYVALELIRNAVIAAERVFPSCQDTGTALVLAKRGMMVFTNGLDEAEISEGIKNAFQKKNLRYSQLAPLSMYEEKNTGTNLPAQIDIMATSSQAYEFLFIAKGGGSANKAYLFQKTKSLLNPKSMEIFVKETLRSLGTAACPPYHLAFVVGGTSAEMNLKTVKLASCGEYNNLPTSGNVFGRAFRDIEMEKQIEIWAQETGIGAQFGGKYFVHDVRVIRLPRHGASCPVGLGVSCSADRQIKAKITKDGVFLEKLEQFPDKFLPKSYGVLKENSVNINLSQPIAELQKQLSALPVSTRVMLNGTVIVARDIAHAKLLEMVNAGQPLPNYFKQYVVYYAGPAKTPAGFASGSFGPTTSQRMDPYVEVFQALGGSLIMLGKGNRTKQVTQSCQKFGGFYLGSIGGPAARLGRDCITKLEVLDFAELGMEAIWKIEVKNFPAFIIVDDKGNDFFAGRGGEE